MSHADDPTGTEDNEQRSGSGGSGQYGNPQGGGGNARSGSALNPNAATWSGGPSTRSPAPVSRDVSEGRSAARAVPIPVNGALSAANSRNRRQEQRQGGGRGESSRSSARSRGGRRGRGGDGAGRVRGGRRPPAEEPHQRGQGSQQNEGAASLDLLGTSPKTRGGVNANHLLNFRAPPRPVSGQGQQWKSRTRTVNPYNREVFLQANFRFAVAEGCDVRSYAADADRMIAWEDVVQVDVLGGAEAAVCPITLEPLVAPQITGCGHLFSFPAILQHALMHGGPEFRAAAPCPLCFTPIVARELRSARLVSVGPIAVGGMMDFQLLRRPKDSIVPQVCGSQESADRFCKFRVLADPLALFVAVGDELAAHAAAVTAEGGIEAARQVAVCTRAIELLAARAAAAAGGEQEERAAAAVLDTASRAVALCEAAKEAAASAARDAARAAEMEVLFPSLEADAPSSTATPPPPTGGQAKEEEEEEGGRMEGQHRGEGQSLETLLGTSPSGPSGVNMPEEEGDWLYYYQAADGQWVFLHPLNVRCLLACHGSYSALPPTLRARAVEVEELSQSEDSRRRLKFARHLPLSGPFRLVELDLAPLLPPSALAPFADEISARERRRRRRAEERRREAARDKKAAAAAARARQGPSLEEWRLQPRLGAGVSQLADEVAGRLELDGEGEEEEENEQEGGGGSQGGVSFANITRMGFAAAVDSPSLASPDNPPLPGAALTPSAAPLPAGAWGRPRPAPSSEPPAPSPPAAGGSRGRRGRKGTVLLSSTGGQRRY